MDYLAYAGVAALVVTLFGGVLIMSTLSKLGKNLVAGSQVLVTHEKRISALETKK